MFFDISFCFFEDSFFKDTLQKKDIHNVIARAKKNGVKQLIICCTTIEEAYKAIKICKKNNNIYFSFGLHPMSVSKYITKYSLSDPLSGSVIEIYQHFLEDLKRNAPFIEENKFPNGKLVCFGEFGLDAFREEYVPLETQRVYFKAQLDFFAQMYKSNISLPLFLHSRETAGELMETIAEFEKSYGIVFNGVVHSFNGSEEEKKIILGHSKFFIGINGCAFKSNACIETLKDIPNERILLETDSPYCKIGSSYEGFRLVGSYKGIEPFEEIELRNVNKKRYLKLLEGDDCDIEESIIKGRNEPCKIVEVFKALANAKGIVDEKGRAEFMNLIYNNSCKLFLCGAI